MAIRRFVCIAVLIALWGCAQQPSRVWRTDDIAANPTAYVALNAQGQTVTTVSAERIRNLIQAKERIEQVSGQRAQLLIMEGSDANALSTFMGGVPTVAFTVGMVDLLQDDVDAFAAILGHEYAHLTLNHLSQRKRREETRQGFTQVIGAFLGFLGVPMGGAIAEVTTEVGSRMYTRDEEREADRVGFDYMRKAGFDPRGAVRAWQRMSSQGGFSIPFLSSHPASDERMHNMKQLAGE